MASRARDDASRRTFGLALGGLGLALLFGPAVALLLLPPGYTPAALALMLAGIVCLLAGFLKLPRSIRPKV